MDKTIAAYTAPGAIYPGYVNVSRHPDGSVTVIVRSEPRTVDGFYICGFAKDKGAHGRCTRGDDRCNNYCNMAPEKGPMAKSPLPCSQTIEGAQASLRLSPDVWAEIKQAIAAGEL